MSGSPVQFVLSLVSLICFSLHLEAAEIAVGLKAPDFQVTNIEGKAVKLSDWVGQKNLVVVFSRASWCPYCMGQLKDLTKNYAAIQKKDAEILVVFREERDGSEGLKKSQSNSGAKFPLLLDLDKKNTADYSTTGFTTYVIGKDGNIAAILAGTKPKRPQAEEILKAIPE
jgi:peroxiredoxin